MVSCPLTASRLQLAIEFTVRNSVRTARGRKCTSCLHAQCRRGTAAALCGRDVACGSGIRFSTRFTSVGSSCAHVRSPKLAAQLIFAGHHVCHICDFIHTVRSKACSWTSSASARTDQCAPFWAVRPPVCVRQQVARGCVGSSRTCIPKGCSASLKCQFKTGQ